MLLSSLCGIPDPVLGADEGSRPCPVLRKVDYATLPSNSPVFYSSAIGPLGFMTQPKKAEAANCLFELATLCEH